MASTVVAELDAEVLARLDEYASEFMADFGLIIRRYWAGVYLQGLMLDGERKSIQPLAQRVNVPGWHGDTMEALQQFVNQSPWDEQAVLRTYRRLLAASLADTAGVFVIDDTGFAKKAVIPLVSGDSTPAPWARRTTARWRSRSTTRRPEATTRWHCACFCRRRGRASRSECRRCGYQQRRRCRAPKARLPWTCSIRCAPKDW